MRRAEQRPLADLTQSIDALIAEYYSRQAVPETEEIPILNAKPKIEGRLTEGCRTVITATDFYGTRRGRRGFCPGFTFGTDLEYVPMRSVIVQCSVWVT